MKTVMQPLFLTGGVNLNKDPRVIRPDQLAKSENAFPVISGILGKRGGFRASSWLVVNADLVLYPLAIAIAPPVTGFDIVVHYHIRSGGISSHYLAATNLNNPLTGFNVGIRIGDGQSDYLPTRFLNYRGIIIAVIPGLEGYYSLLPKKAGMGYEWVKQTFNFDPSILNVQKQTIPVLPRAATQYRQRMVWGNFGVGRSSWIIFADKATTTVMRPNDGAALMSLVGTDVLALNGRHVEVGAIEGENINAMQEVSLASMGSQIDNVLMLLTDKTCVFITGEILQTNDSGATDPNGLFGTYKENRVNYECGCVSQDSLIKTPYGWIWASADDVWILRGNTPERIGTNIRPALLNCPATMRKHWSASYSNGIYVLQLVTTNSSFSDGAMNVDSNIHEYWYLDLRDGDPRGSEDAKWYGPMKCAVDDGSTFVMGKLFSISDSDGSVKVYATGMYASLGQPAIIDILSNNDAYDKLFYGVSGAAQWAPNSLYQVGDVVRPRINIAGADNYGSLHVATASVGAHMSNALADPTFGAAGSGGVAVDNDITWTEITALACLYSAGRYQDIDRVRGEYLVDIRARDSLLENPVSEKLVRRVDANIACINKVSIGMSVVKDQSSIVGSLGADTFGQEAPILDVTQIDTNIGGLKSVARTFRPDEGGLIQCRQAQLKIQDSNSFIIDESNNYFNLGFFKNDGGGQLEMTGMIQAEITQGLYTSINDILQAIVDRLNLYSDVLATLTGMTLGANPFSYSDSYVSTSPYFNRINMAYTNLHDVVAMAICMDSVDRGISNSPALVLGDFDGSSSLVLRAKKLASLLGFDTSTEDFEGHIPITTPVFAGDQTFAFGVTNAIPASPLKLDAIQMVQKFNSVRFDVAGAAIAIQPKTAIPLKTLTRS